METFRYRIRGGSLRHEITSVELAAELRHEGRLGVGVLRDSEGVRCLRGFLWDYREPATPCRLFSDDSRERIRTLGLDHVANDNFVGTPEERCAYFAALLEAL